MSNSLRIGSVLKELRAERGLTLRQLADLAQVTSAYLSRLENEKISPSIHTLKRVAEGLGVPVIDFFANDLVDAPSINAPENWDRKVIKGLNAEIRQMGGPPGSRKMSPFFLTIPPRGGGAYETWPFDGEEFVVVLEGRLTLELAGGEEELTPGTLVYFSALRPLAWTNKSDERCRLMLVRYS